MTLLHVSLFEICNFAGMDKIETIKDFCKRKFDWMPDNLKIKSGILMSSTLSCSVGTSYYGILFLNCLILQ